VSGAQPETLLSRFVGRPVCSLRGNRVGGPESRGTAVGFFDRSGLLRSAKLLFGPQPVFNIMAVFALAVAVQLVRAPRDVVV
jgi:hypothetical protein